MKSLLVVLACWTVAFTVLGCGGSGSGGLLNQQPTVQDQTRPADVAEAPIAAEPDLPGMALPEEEVGALFASFVEAVRREDWREVYDGMLSPSARQSCPYDESLSDVQSAKVFYSDDYFRRLGFDKLVIRVEQEQAYVSYIGTLDGKDFFAVTEGKPDVWIKINDRWYLDAGNPLEGCA